MTSIKVFLKIKSLKKKEVLICCCSLVTSIAELREDNALIERIADALSSAELHEKTGELYERVNKPEKALQCYKLGGAYAKAVELARRTSPQGEQLI